MKMKKKLLITGFIVGIVLLATGIAFFLFTNADDKFSLEENYEELDIQSEQVQNLTNMLTDSNDLRKAYLDVKELSNDEILKHILISLKKDDYKVVNITPVKIMCYVTDGISFVSDSKCKIWVINNSKIMAYQKKLFNTDKKLSYDEINYQGMHCKNNGKKYYCHITKYTPSDKNFSIIDKVSKNKDEIYIYEYYLNVNLENINKCKQFYPEKLCANYTKVKLSDLTDDVIKDKGVYYKHTFMLNDSGEYYLAYSEVMD